MESIHLNLVHRKGQSVPILISGRGKEENKELQSTYYILDTLCEYTLCIFIYLFIHQIFIEYLFKELGISPEQGKVPILMVLSLSC